MNICHHKKRKENDVLMTSQNRVEKCICTVEFDGGDFMCILYTLLYLIYT